ncbi:MAG TPA: hypothetical protein VEY71_02585 [Chitinophagales bacterium]|nr:hypothetical protein [Chitinophagales bacterium]
MTRFHVVRVLILATLLLPAACSRDIDKTETIKCDGNCVIVFKPDAEAGKAALDGDDEKEFLDVLADHQRYADDFKKQLSKTDIKFSESTVRYIIIDNGKTQTKLDTRHEDYMFGVILAKPGAEPEMHHGIFTDMEYQMFVQKYFK